MEGKDFCCYEFGEFRLDARRRALLKNGEKVPLPARNFDLLLFMVENGGRILEHDELLDKVWAGTFVEQATLKKGISALRQILAEKPENEFIQTIPRRGYSFVSPVRVVPENQEVFLVRETEQEIIVEEYEETDDATENSAAPEKIIEISAVAHKALPAVETKKLNVFRLAVISFAGIAAIALTFFAFKPYLSKTVEPQFSVENVRVNRITNTGKIIDAVISPDGNYLLYVLGDKEGLSLWLRQMATGGTSRLTTPISGGFWGFGVAPDNSYVYYVLKKENEPKSVLYKIPLLGGEPRKISEKVANFAISPDGKRIALVRISDKTKIFSVNMDGEDERVITDLPGNLRLWGLSWTPDGTALLCAFRRFSEDKSLYFISEISAEDGKETIILPPQEKVITGPVWLPDKSAILLTMREPNADVRQVWQYLPASQVWRRVTNDSNSYKFINLARDGKTIVAAQESRLVAIWVADNLPIERRPATDKKSLLSNSDSFRQITDGITNFDWLGWMADNRIMYSTTEDRRELIYTVNRDGTSPRQITGGEDGIWLYASVTGSGSKIAYISSKSGIKQVWRIDEDGKNATQMTRATSPVIKARILRDDSTVLYTVQQPGGVFLFKQTADGQTTQLTNTGTGAFAISADETLLAAETTDEKTGKLRVELDSLVDGKTIRTFDFESVRELTFTPDGKNLAYDIRREGLSQIMIQPLDGGEPYALTDFQTDFIFSFGWSPDGTRLAVIRGKPLSDAVLIKTENR